MDANKAQAPVHTHVATQPSVAPHAQEHVTVPDITSGFAIENMAPDLEFNDEMSTEDRLEARRKVLKKGIIAYAAGNFQVECTIRDLNSKGAKLRLSGDVTVPSCFDLVILPEKITQKSQVSWRDGLDIGIQFIRDNG